MESHLSRWLFAYAPQAEKCLGAKCGLYMGTFPLLPAQDDLIDFVIGKLMVQFQLMI